MMSSKERLEYAKQVLHIESSAIQETAELLGESFLDAIDSILHCIPQKGGIQARFITSGIGKAGIIAQKISATFASTGIPSFFLHPAEAVHGDLGRFAEGDVVLLLSNSGETEEILNLLPYLKRMGSRTIALTGKKDSRLARHSDIVLLISGKEEAGPIALSPTSSTTAMLALGDALAMVVQKEQQFSREDFARFHPGGALGRALTTVEEIMRTGERHCEVRPEEPLREVLKKMSATPGRPGAASVVDSTGKLVGVFTDGNLRRVLEHEDASFEAPIEQHMGKEPKTIRCSALVQDAMHIISKYHIDQLIVVDDDDRAIGMIDIQDILELKRG